MENLQHQFNQVIVWVLAITFVLALFVLHGQWSSYRDYWTKLGIKSRQPSVLFGEFGLYDSIFNDRAKIVLESVQKLGKLYGTFAFNVPLLVVADADVLRQICIRDFDKFLNHNKHTFDNKYQKRFLYFLQDDEWKQTRSMMTPCFTSSKIKRMFQLFDECSNDLVDNIAEQFVKQTQSGKQAAHLDLPQIYSMYALDGITTCCYSLHLERQKSTGKLGRGLTRDSLLADVNKVFSLSIIRLAILVVVPEFILKALNYSKSPESSWQSLVKRVEHIIATRRQKAGEGAPKHDLLQMLVEARNSDQVELNEMDCVENHHASLTDELVKNDYAKMKTTATTTPEQLPEMIVLSNAIFMLSAGVETTKSALSNITYFLAHHLDVQEKLHEEIKKIAKFEQSATGGGRLKFDYDELTSCQYLDAVISESLRLMCPTPITERCANSDYYIEKYGVTVPKGSRVMLSIHGVHHDPDYWQDPHQFKPDRFMPSQRDKIVPGSYMPFGMGPRHCIGMRFSLTETKLGLAKVSMNFKFEPAPGTIYPPVAKTSISLAHMKDCRVIATVRRVQQDEKFDWACDR